MADFGGTFDATGVAPREEIKALPPGDYKAVIEKSEWVTTKDGSGRFLELEGQVIDGPHKGRKFWDRLNLENKSTQAVEIARATLSAICHAIGKLQVSNSEQLHNVPLCIVIKAGKDDKGNVTGEVKAYKPLSGMAGGATVGGATSSTTSSGGDGKMPWER